MIRLLRALAVVVILADCLQCGSAQSPTVTPNSQAALDEAARLDQVIEKLYGEGRFQEAVPLAERSLALREKVLGPMHPEVATSLNNLAELHRAQGAYGKAAPLHVRALDIWEKALGPTHLDVATSLTNLAEIYRAQGIYSKAAPLYIRALDIREKALGSMHPEVATSLENLAGFYRAEGAYGKSEPLLVRALAIREKVLGPTHPDVAKSLNNLAVLYQEQGVYEKAELLLVRALAIREKALGPTHLDLAASLNNLAELYRAEGAYWKTEPLLVRALAIQEKVLGPRHPDVAASLNNLAGAYQDQGAYGKAEALYARAIAIREKVLGPRHPDVAASLNNLALLYEAQGAYGKAEPLLVRALDIWKKALGAMDPDVAASLNNLALLYEAQGAYSKAEPLLVRALDIWEKALGSIHPLVATGLNNLATLQKAQGAYGRAESSYARSLEIREKVLGPMHPNTASSLNNLAELYWAQGAYGRAESMLSRAAKIQEGQLGRELPRLSGPRKRAWMTLLQGETEGLVSLHADAMPSSDHALELALTTVLQRKGRILDSLVDSETVLRAHLTPPLRDLLERRNRARTELVALLYAPADPRSPLDGAAVAAARARIDDLESALGTASAAFRTQPEPVTMAKIEAVLPQDAALVEFVRYHRLDPRQPQQRWQEARYVAYLLTSRGPPQWVALGAAAPIDAEVDAVLAAMGGKVPASIAKTALQRLDALVFAPIRVRLTGISHIILAPDGKLNLVPFEALVDTQGHYALQNYLVSYVTAGRDLVQIAAPHYPRSPAVIVAGPDYGPSRSPAMPSMVSFVALAGGLAEAMDLKRYFLAGPVTGGNATKSALAALTGPAVLHLITHGFYARAPAQPMMPPTLVMLTQRDLSRGMFVNGGASSLPSPPQSEDPVDALDRAGLAMAGANQGAGIVTAREIAGFDWWGTQLVVLSACETGVGVVPSGDGVYGLRRALVLAGAASQVVSLWSVSDSSTRQLMRDYYAELARGTGRAEALRQAKLHLMRQPRYAHPYYWAAFIPAGDWRPLDKTIFSSRRPTP